MHTEDDVKALAKLLLVEVRKSPDAWVNCEALARVALEFCEEREKPEYKFPERKLPKRRTGGVDLDPLKGMKGEEPK